MYSRLSQGDSFYRLFLSDACLGCACYDKCKFKYNNSSADIRIGDAWGSYYKDNEDGVSAAIAFTKKGDDFLKACNVELEELPFSTVAEGQMKTAPKRGWKFELVSPMLRNDSVSLGTIIAKIEKQEKMNRQIDRIKNPSRTVKNIFKRVLKR